MPAERNVTLWPTKANYARFHELCDDETPDTFEEFQSTAEHRIIELKRAQGITIEKVLFDPDAMAVWCKANHGGVNAMSRRFYAAFLTLSD